MSRLDPGFRVSLNGYLRKHHADLCRHWFDDIEPLDVQSGVLRLVVREPVQLRYLQRCCVPQFTEAAQAITGRLLAVRFIGPDEAIETPPAPPERRGSASSREAPEPRPSGETTVVSATETRVQPEPDDFHLDDQVLLSPDYAFEHFVVGPENRLAHAAAMAVAEKPGRAYNPFFIHGGVGLGKTHLLQAICQAMLRRAPRTRIVYISCNTFMDLFHDAVRAGRMSDFRSRFRTADVLVIDDIHFLSKHEQTQEEFFHTFNALYQAGKQLVLSSDAAPHEIPALEERLTSRFSCGLVARIDRPSYETRVAILKAKAALHDLQIPDEVPAYIAARIDSNIRELEGALTKVRGMAMAHHVEVSLDLAKSALNESQPMTGAGQPTIQSIIETVSRFYDVKLTDLLSKRRHKSVALPRQVCMWLARRHTRYSLEEIGGYFGGRDHTTVMHAIKTINARRGDDAQLLNDVERLEEQLLVRERQSERLSERKG
jgi:chromosomal replication initiator protein